jgi:Kef-type K+ transport system membrane component KefB
MPASLQLALLIAILFPAGKVVAAACTRFGIPAILGELLVGLIAGPACFHLLHMRLFHAIPTAEYLVIVALTGGLVLMFMPGWRRISTVCGSQHHGFLVAPGVIWLCLGAGAPICWDFPGFACFWRSADGYERIHFSQDADGW